MGISWGNVIGQGIIGGIGGAGQAAYVNAHEELKAERKAVEEERLSKLRMGEFKAKTEMERQDKDAAVAKERGEVADFYKRTEMPDKPAATFTDTLGDEATGEAAGGIIRDAQKPTRGEQIRHRAAEAGKTGNERIIKQTREEAEFEDRQDERKATREDRKADLAERAKDRDEDRADRKAARGDAKADRDESRREARERDERHIKLANERDWKVDADGNYRRPDGSIVTEQIREGGKLLGEKPIKAPESKVKVKPEVYSVEDQIKQTDKEIMQALREGDKEGADRLKEEKRRLLSGKPEPAGPVTPGSQAEFNTLPKGARYLNPADGRIYIKK